MRRVMVNRNISVWRSRATRTSHGRAAGGRPATTCVRDHALWTALRRLPPRQRTVIALRYLADQTEAQTAALMGCSVGTVKSQTSDAMRSLRRLLDVPEEESMTDLETRLRGALAEEVAGTVPPIDLLHDVRRAAARRRARRASGAVAWSSAR